MTPEQTVDPFEEVRIRKKGEPTTQTSSEISQNPEQNAIQNQDDPFSQVRIKKAEGFPLIYETGRHATRLASRIAETIGGIPGDISQLIQSGVLAGMEKLTGFPTTEEDRKKSRGNRPPTSSELRELSEQVTGGFTSPQSDIEKTIDEYAETAASLLGPIKFRKALGVALGGVSAKESLKVSGLGETSQELGKLGTMFLLTALNPKGAMKYASSQYEIADQLSKGASIGANALENNLNSLITDLRKGITTPSKNAVIKPAEDILGKIQNGQILVEDLTASKRDLNTLMKDPALLQREKKLLKVVGKEVDKAIKPYERLNPAFGKAYRPANEIYGAVMQGTKAYDFIKKNLGAKSVLGVALGEAILGHPEYIIPTIAGTAGAAGAAKGFDFFTRLAKSKELQKFYSKAMAAALAEDLPSLRVYSNKIDEEFEKSKLKNPKDRNFP